MIVAAFFLSIHMDRAIGFARDIDQVDMTRITFFEMGNPPITYNLNPAMRNTIQRRG